MNVIETIRTSLQNNQGAVERALVSLDDASAWHNSDVSRGGYMAAWCRKGNHLSGRYVTEARGLVLKYVQRLVPLSLTSTQKKIKELEASLEKLHRWQEALEEELSKDSVFSQEDEPCLDDGRTVSQACFEDGIY